MEEHLIEVLTRDRVVIGRDNKKVNVLKGKVNLNGVTLFEVDSDKDHLIILEAKNQLLEFSSKLAQALKSKKAIVKMLRQSY